MKWIFAILVPPIAVFRHGRISEGLVNILLLAFCWWLAPFHALWVVNRTSIEDRRIDRLVRAIERR